MKDLSIIQEYMICAADKKGRLSGYGVEREICFVAAGLLELQMEKCIHIGEKTVETTAPLPIDRLYLSPFYDRIAEMEKKKSPLKLTRLANAYLFSNYRNWVELLESVGNSLVQLGLAEEGPAVFIRRRKGYIPAPETVRTVIEMLRAELLEEGEASQEAAALAILLEKGGCLKLYFSPYERKEIKNKLKKLVDSPDGKMVKDMVNHIRAMYMTLISAAGSSASV